MGCDKVSWLLLLNRNREPGHRVVHRLPLLILDDFILSRLPRARLNQTTPGSLPLSVCYDYWNIRLGAPRLNRVILLLIFFLLNCVTKVK